jgi:hypothetical protein
LPSDELIARLQRLHGEFGLSDTEKRSRKYALVGLAAPGFLFFFLAYLTSSDRNPFYHWEYCIDGVLAGAAVILGVATPGRLDRRYFFNNGVIGEMTGKGKVLWQEDLATLDYAGCRKGKVIELHWPALRWRTLELYSSLAEQLDRPG